MKKINVNKEACIGCGACVAIDPEHFDFNDEGLSNVINNENLESSELQNAIDSCPTSAINMVDGCCGDTCNCDSNCECDSDCECDCECSGACNCTEENNCGCHCFEE